MTKKNRLDLAKFCLDQADTTTIAREKEIWIFGSVAHSLISIAQSLEDIDGRIDNLNDDLWTKIGIVDESLTAIQNVIERK